MAALAVVLGQGRRAAAARSWGRRGGERRPGISNLKGEKVRIVGFSWFDCRQSTTGCGGCRFAWLAKDIIAGPRGGVLGGIRLSTVDGSPWWLSTRVVGRLRGVVTIAGPRSGVLDCRQSMAALRAVETRAWPIQGGRHHRGSKGLCFGKEPTVRSLLQSMMGDTRVGRSGGATSSWV